MKEVRLLSLCCYKQEAKTGASIFYVSICSLSSRPVFTRWKLRWVTKTWGCHTVEGDPALGAFWTLGSWKDEQLGVGKYWILNWRKNVSQLPSLPPVRPQERNVETSAQGLRDLGMKSFWLGIQICDRTLRPWLQFQPLAVIHYSHHQSVWGKQLSLMRPSKGSICLRSGLKNHTFKTRSWTLSTLISKPWSKLTFWNWRENFNQSIPEQLTKSMTESPNSNLDV